MNLEEIQIKAVDTYKRNIKFLKEHFPKLHEKVELFSIAVETGAISCSYELEYKDNKYFDILDIKNNSYIYGENSEYYSKKIIKNISLDVEKQSFKTFHEYEYKDGVVESIKKASIMSSFVYGNAPIVDYVNRNLPDVKKYKSLYCYVIFGVGLGIHIPLIDKIINARYYLIIEPNLEIFRLSLFITDYSLLAKKKMLNFFIAQEKPDFYKNIRDFHNKTYLYNHYLKFFYFSKSCETYFEDIQSVLSSQPHNLFSYDRQLKNFHKTSTFIKERYNFINLKDDKKESSYFNNKSVLLLAAGPSLKKNIKFIKENRNKFILISIFSVCPMLLEEGIEPDIITNYDDHSTLFLKIYNQIIEKKKEYFDTKVLILGSQVDKKTIDLFPKENVYFFQALFEIKKDYGILTAPSIGEISYALSLILCPKEIYLIGLDMALDPDTGKTHSDGYHDTFRTEKTKDIKNFSLRKNVIQVKGNHLDKVETLQVYKISIDAFSILRGNYNKKNISVYNFSNGAYLEGTIPLKFTEFKKDKFQDVNKDDNYFQLKKYIQEFSTKELTKEDEQYIKEIINSAETLRLDINNIFNKKYSSLDDYLKLSNSFHDLLGSYEQKCKDLVSIIYNYSKHNLPYILFLLNTQKVNNPKSHIKKLNKAFSLQINKVIDCYLDSLKDLV